MVAEEPVLNGYLGMENVTFTLTDESIDYSPCTEFPEQESEWCPSVSCNEAAGASSWW